MSPTLDELTGPLLRNVSRSFYLTLRVLPRAIRPQISLAYLLARATDTIADTNAVPRAKRVLLLQQLQNLSHVPPLGEVAAHQTTAGEKRLLDHLPDCIVALDQFDEADCRRIQELLKIIVSGQIFDLQRFPEGKLTALTDDAEFDRYIYMVAGCVGEFWTRMCRAHFEGWKDERMEEWGVKFGKGLQLVNVLRDIPADLRIGRCYVPVKDPESIPLVYAKWLDTAVGYLDAGWQYTLAIPATQRRLRLACIWPIWIGLKTIARLRVANPLEATLKVTRGEVYAIMARSFLVAGSDALLNAQYRPLHDAASSR